LNLQGLDISAAAIQQLLAVEPGLWKKEVAEVGKYLEQYGSRLPAEMLSQLQEVAKRLGA
jgi:phosphoenolpyruvate carboxykinase (GTP)